MTGKHAARDGHAESPSSEESSAPEDGAQIDGFHPPRQDRSRRTLDRFLSATERLLREKDFREISVDEIVERADSSKGAFYARFDRKEALLDVLRSERFGAVLDEWTAFLSPERWAERPLGEFLAALVGRLVRIYARRGPLMREFMLRARRDPEIRERALVLNRHVLEGVDEVVRGHPASVDHPDPGRAVELGVVMVGAAARDRLLFGGSSTDGVDVDPNELTEELTRALVRYLEVGPDA